MFGLPIGLTMTVVMGSELFTGSTAIVTAAFLDGQCTLLDLLKNWVVSYIGNLLGSAFLAWLCIEGGSMASALHAFMKVGNGEDLGPPSVAIGRGFGRGLSIHIQTCDR